MSLCMKDPGKICNSITVLCDLFSMSALWVVLGCWWPGSVLVFSTARCGCWRGNGAWLPLGFPGVRVHLGPQELGGSFRCHSWGNSGHIKTFCRAFCGWCLTFPSEHFATWVLKRYGYTEEQADCHGSSPPLGWSLNSLCGSNKVTHFLNNALIYNQDFVPKDRRSSLSPPEDTLCTPEFPLNFLLQFSHLGTVELLYI